METDKFNNNFFSLNPLPSWIYDHETLEILEVNLTALNHYGYSREEFLTLTLKDLRPPQEVSKLISAHIDIKNREGNIYFGIFTHQKKDGTLFQMEINGHKLDFNDRSCILAVCQDVTKKIEQEEQLLQSERRFKALVQEGADMISIIDADGKYSYTSPTTTAILGITPDEFEGKTIFDFIHPDDIEKAAGYMERISSEGKIIVEPFRLLDSKNEWRWIETVLTNMLDNPAVNGIVANSRDITEQVNAQKQLEANELFNRTVLESSPDCLKVLDKEGRLQYMNFNGLCQMEIDDFGSFKNKNWSTLWGSENEALVKASIDKALSGEPSQFTAFCPTVKGTPKWWDVLVSPVSNSDEPIHQIISVSRDITKQKEEEHQLKLLSSVITNTKDAVLITEAKSFDEPGPRIIYVNEAFTKMTGYEASEVIGKTPRILQGPNSNQEELAKLSKALRNWESCEITTTNYKKNGEEFWINFTVSPVADENGWYTHWIAIERDVTESKRIEEKLMEAKETAEESERKMNEAQKLAHLGSWYYDVINQVSQWSEETYNIWGLDPETTSVEFIDHQKLIHPKDWERFNVVINNAIEKGVPYKMELELVRSDGNYKTVNTIGSPIFDDNNNVIAFRGTTQDISELINTQKELIIAKEKAEKSEHIITLASNLAKIGYWEVDLIKETIFWSDQVYKIYESDPITFTPSIELAINFYREDYRELAQSSFEQCIITGNPYDIEAVIVTANKKEIWVRTTAKAEIIDGVCLRVYGSFQDINDRKEAEESAYAALIEKNNILESISDNFYALDEDFRFSYMNESCSTFLRVDPLEIIGKDIFEAHPNLLDTEFEQNLMHVSETKEYVSFEFYYEPFERWFQENIYPTPSGLSVYFQDITDKKEAEQERNNLQVTLEKSLNEIYIFEAETLNFIYVNRGALLNLGYTEQEIKTLTPLDLKPQYNSTSFKELLTPLLNNEKEKIVFYTYHKRKDGSNYPVEIHLQFVTQVNAKSFLAIVLDITERKKAEEENKFKANLLNNVNQAAIATNIDGIVNYWNKAAENIYGWTHEEAIGKNILDLTPHDKSIGEAKKIMEVLTKGQTWRGELNVRKKNGSKFPALISNSPIYDENSQLSGIIGISSDISEEVKNKELLRNYTQQLELSNERFEKVTEATNDAILDYDVVNNKLFWGRGFQTLFGHSMDETKPSFDFLVSLIHEGDRGRIATKFSQYMQDSTLGSWYEEYRFLRADGSFAFVIDRATFIRDDQGNVIRVIGAMTDISERKNFEHQLVELNESLQTYAKDLERSNEELEQFAFITSHDLQEPLRMISSFMDQLKRKYEDQLDERALEYIYFASDGAKRMKQIILDLLDYSRAGRPRDSLEQVNLSRILSDFKQLRRKIISEKSVTISASELPTIYSYKAGITQVFHSLVDNAIKYSKQGIAPHIEINATEETDEWIFSIKDNGIGIDSEFYDKIFIIFQRLHNRNEYEGTGIGLSIAKKHVEFLGGKIWLESSPGEGTTFYFTISKHKLTH